MSAWIQVVGLVVIPSVALIVLFRYMLAAIEQAEAVQKPCVVLLSIARDPTNAVILNATNPGDLLLLARDGLLALQNIGTGPAANVHYVVQGVGEPENPTLPREGSIQIIPASDIRCTHTSATIFPRHKFECSITYESLSKRRYESHTFVNDAVLGEFKFRQMNLYARLCYSAREYRRQRKARRFEPIA